MELDDDTIYAMPLAMGPLPSRADRPRSVYRKTDSLFVQFRTEPDAIRGLVPGCYIVGEEATITVSFTENTGVDFLAGRGYRIVTITVPARFEGTRDQLAGPYTLVMYEDDAIPILGGRERLGVPKVYADITGLMPTAESTLRCEASLWGHLLFGIEVESMKRQSFIVRRTAEKRLNEHPYLCYKYIPSFDGAPDASYPTVMWMDRTISELWIGDTARLWFGDVSERELSFAGLLHDRLRRVPVGEVVMTGRMEGSAVLRQDPCRRIS